jgi:uncharacterized protein YegP (UPF0339 family)
VLCVLQEKQRKAKMGTFVLAKQKDDQFYWKLNAANGETLCGREGYATKQNAINGIESCQRNAPGAEIDDQTTD